MPPITMSNGEYVERYITPQLHKEFVNNRMGFLATLGKAPAKAITKSGIIVRFLIRNTEAVFNRNTPFTDEEVKKLTFGHGFIEWGTVSTVPQKTDRDELRLASDNRNQTLRNEHTETRLRKVRNTVIRSVCPEDLTDPEIMVIYADGEPRADGYHTVTAENIYQFGELARAKNIVQDGKWNFTLNNRHVTDLQINEKTSQLFKENYYNANKSAEIKSFGGFNFGWDLELPNYTSAGLIKPQGSVVDTDDDYIISPFHYTPNTFYHAEGAFATATDMSKDTRNNPPESEYREISEFASGSIFTKYTGAIISKKA